MARALGQELKKLAVDMQDYVERDRAMDRGPMLAYLARWFYALAPGVQATILAEGKRLSDSDAANGVPDFREAHDKYLENIDGRAIAMGAGVLAQFGSMPPFNLAGSKATLSDIAGTRLESVDPGTTADERGKDVPLVPLGSKIEKSKPNRKRAKSSN